MKTLDTIIAICLLTTTGMLAFYGMTVAGELLK